MQELHIKDKAPLAISSTLGFAMGLRYLNLANTNQWEESQALICNFIPLYYGPDPAGMIRKKYA